MNHEETVNRMRLLLESSTLKAVVKKSAERQRERQFMIGCSFCHKLKADVGALVRGVAQDHRPIYICDECVWQAWQALPEKLRAEYLGNPPTPAADGERGWGPDDHFEQPED